MTTRTKYDFNRPDTRELRDRITHGVFLREGNLVAFPLCFPGATTPLPPDESFVTALSVAPDHMVYGGISGRSAHVVAGMFHGVTGCVLVLGTVPDATSIPAICCTPGGWVAACNGPSGGRLIRGAYVPMPFDLIQEWSFSRIVFEELGTVADGAPLVHTVPEPSGGILATTARHLLRLDLTTAGATIQPLADVTGSRISPVLANALYGLSEARTLWRWDGTSGRLERKAVELPKEANTDAGIHWAIDPARHRLYLADSIGNLFILESSRISGPVAKTPLAPVTSLATTADGRLFGTCGEGMEHFFRYSPDPGTLDDIGMAVSTLERRRYGYQFADAAMGRDGQLFFAENDSLGHLWIYFPAIIPMA